MAENNDYRLEVLIAIRRLERLDKDDFMDEERTEAEEIYEQRKQKEIEDGNILASLSQVNSNQPNDDESLAADEKFNNNADVEE